MKQIKLSQGFVAIIDDRDYELVSSYKWHVYISRAKVPVYYAQSSFRINGITKTISMHLLILGKKKGFIIDHADRNGLNNTRENIRFVTYSQNSLNTKAKINRANKYRGVFFDKRDSTYYSQIMVQGKRISLGRSKSEYECALMRDEAALKYHGELANLNFPI
jgi:hypothetical protein